MALNQLFPGSDAANEALCMVGEGRVALGSKGLLPLLPLALNLWASVSLSVGAAV